MKYSQHEVTQWGLGVKTLSFIKVEPIFSSLKRNNGDIDIECDLWSTVITKCVGLSRFVMFESEFQPGLKEW